MSEEVAITRTFRIDDITPQELAALFADMSDYQQAEFFSSVWRIARNWPGAGWCQQCCSMVSRMDRDGLQAVQTLAAHVTDGGVAA